jgi:hypothetical protein
MNTREDMIAEAIDLEIEHKGNISNIALAKLLAKAKGEPEPEFDAPPSPKAKAPEPEEEVEEEVAEAAPTRTSAQALYARRRMKIAAAKKAAMVTSIVTITSKDSRENEVSTTAFLSCENQHFAVAKSVPLDIPVQLEKCLIENARTCKIPMHRDEIKNGRRTGNKVTLMVNKYVISYSQSQGQ